MLQKSIACFVLLLSFGVQLAVAQVRVQSLTQQNQKWFFREKDDASWLSAKVPGEVHLDLMHHKIIPDPYFRDNEIKVQWVEKMNWEYNTTFNVTNAGITNSKNIDLVFDGLDTYADVYLNNRLILSANNMFRQWRVNIKPYLQAANNKLNIVFYSAQNKVDSLAKVDIPYVIPDNPRAYVRKAQYHFGWDWGPKLTTAGIWQPIRIEGYDTYPAEKPYKVPVDVKLVEKPDDKGTSFYLQIDGKPTYMKGANYIPMDAFVTRTTKDDYRKMLIMAKEANMNMLRIWGGGIYENEYFYELCDSLGIYVWQDFMFAGTMVPGDKDFFDNVREEVKYQVKRLRNYKSVVIWCGNNEIEEAFYKWGWHQSFRISQADSVKLIRDYERLFKDSIPAWVKELDPDRPYVSTSPRYHWSVPASITEGDSHYWGTWWGGEDFEVFETKTGRFISEYGMQAMPNYNSVLSFTQPQERYLYSESLKHHQKAGNGFKKLNGYLKGYMIDSALIDKMSVEDYTYLTQCVQYYGFKNMILIHRSQYPYNMGTLLWQLNDCWPVASWSITDYYNRAPKAAWYAVKNTYSETDLPARDKVRPKDLQLQNPNITYKVIGNTITLKATAFAKYVYVDIAGNMERLSDNYFDLRPGEEKKITFDVKALKGKPVQIKIKSLWNVHNTYGHK